MVAILPEQNNRTSRTRPALIDCDFHNELDSIKDLYPYLAQRWIDHIETFGLQRATGGYFPRFMDHREDAKPPSGRRSGSEVAWSRADFLDPYNVAHAMLIPLTSAAGVLNLDLGTALATAVNDWQVAEWLEPEPRLRASIAVAPEDPLAAAREVERCGKDNRFVQVFMPGRTHEPLGRRKYWPIYEAASKYGLPIMSHAFGSYGYPITGAGQASFYVEEHVGPAQAVQANVISLVAEGVFETFPNLNFVSVENGFGWIPSLMWRMDATYKELHAEVPHLKRLPSEYIRQHVYLTTQPVEEPHRPQQFNQLLDHFGDMVDHILFASDYPHWDSDDPDFALPNGLPDELVQAIQFDNAKKLYRL